MRKQRLERIINAFWEMSDADQVMIEALVLNRAGAEKSRRPRLRLVYDRSVSEGLLLLCDVGGIEDEGASSWGGAFKES